MLLFRGLKDHFCRLRITRVKNDRNTFFNNPGFFRCDFCHRVAQIFHMIKTDRRQHHRDRMLHKICRIEPSAKSRLHHEILHLLLRKDQKSCRKEQLKIRRMRIAVLYHRVYFFLYPGKCPREHFMGNIFPVDLKTLRDLHKVRGSEQSGALSCPC